MSCDARSHRPAVRTDGRSCAGAARRAAAARRAVCGYVGGCIVGRGDDDERQQRVHPWQAGRDDVPDWLHARGVCGVDEFEQRVSEMVTNAKDKEMQLPKILKLDENVKEAMIDGAKFVSRATIDLDHD